MPSSSESRKFDSMLRSGGRRARPTATVEVRGGCRRRVRVQLGRGLLQDASSESLRRLRARTRADVAVCAGQVEGEARDQHGGACWPRTGRDASSSSTHLAVPRPRSSCRLLGQTSGQEQGGWSRQRVTSVLVRRRCRGRTVGRQGRAEGRGRRGRAQAGGGGGGERTGRDISIALADRLSAVCASESCAPPALPGAGRARPCSVAMRERGGGGRRQRREVMERLERVQGRSGVVGDLQKMWGARVQARARLTVSVDGGGVVAGDAGVRRACLRARRA